MTPYQIFLLVVLVLWPLVIGGLLLVMGGLERYVSRRRAVTPEEAGLEPVAGSPPEREVQIILGDKVIGEAD